LLPLAPKHSSWGMSQPTKPTKPSYDYFEIPNSNRQ
jgi:hypothetical protein